RATIEEPLHAFDEKQVRSNGRNQKEIEGCWRFAKAEQWAEGRQRKNKADQDHSEGESRQNRIGQAAPRGLSRPDHENDEALGRQGLNEPAGLKHRLAPAENPHRTKKAAE